ncbi:alpha/beta fold hydrolase [Amycolatopsis sp. H20-H5]|uniref:alpha/beta fold hydrolase n=1 Tax=Amycolatopsis sp. H20-H5 TaxID=3046309 RepID=UPI002DB56DA6|nr:alpha/beta fold hydrolase [Amycolatopsis sp. H20-H5]MEC3975588.1 alpha/beta fold hydrolase [Amycolatopsis sp. H20-H5]
MDDVVFDRTGSGEPLVLIHGVGHRRQAWAPVIPLLTPYREVIAVDLPGFGESPPREGAYGIEPALETFAEFFADLGLDRPHVAGNSLGGLLSLALGQAGLVRSVTAFSPAGLWTLRQQRYALSMLRTHRAVAQRMPERTARRLASTAAGRAVMTGMIVGRPALLSPDVVLDDMHAMADAPGFAPTLAHARGGFRFEGPVSGLPVTIAWGEHDRILARPRAEDLRKVAPGADLLVLPGCGHVPMSDDPELVAGVLLTGSRESRLVRASQENS